MSSGGRGWDGLGLFRKTVEIAAGQPLPLRLRSWVSTSSSSYWMWSREDLAPRLSDYLSTFSIAA